MCIRVRNKPSKTSKIAAIKMHTTPALKSSKKANLIELKPKHSPVKVIKLGMKFLILLSDIF